MPVVITCVSYIKPITTTCENPKSNRWARKNDSKCSFKGPKREFDPEIEIKAGWSPKKYSLMIVYLNIVWLVMLHVVILEESSTCMWVIEHVRYLKGTWWWSRGFIWYIGLVQSNIGYLFDRYRGDHASHEGERLVSLAIWWQNCSRQCINIYKYFSVD